MSILYTSLSGKDFKHTRDITARETWMQDIDRNLGEDWLILHGKSDRGIIGFDTPEGHKHAWKKLCEIYKSIYECRSNYCKFQWFFFGDVDCYPMPNEMRRFLGGFTGTYRTPICIGRMNFYDWPNAPYGGNLGLFDFKKVGPLFYVGGAGWVFNRIAMMKIGEYLANEPDPPWSDHYDIANGFWMHACDINIVHSPKFRSGPFDTDHEMSDYNPDRKCVTYHYMSEEKMKILYDK